MLITTRDAVYAVKGPDADPAERFLAEGIRCVAEGQHLDAVALEDGRLAIIRDGKARFLEPDLGDAKVTCMLLLTASPLEALLGTRPAALYHLSGGGGAARLGGFDALHVRTGWHTPWGGPPDVRSLAATPDGWIYADIHIGNVMVSPDRGRTWDPVNPDLNEDVHQVTTCPAAPDRVYANTARAVYLSEDRGQSWESRGKALGHRYGRAVAVHPAKPNLCLASVSDGPRGENVHGQLYRTADGGRGWDHLADGFPESTAQNIDTFHLAVTPDGTGWASVGRTLYAGPVRAGAWRRVWQAPDEIVMLSAAGTRG